MTNETTAPSPATLDPPGTIVVIGTTPLGIEAALYGRCLGYDVILVAGTDTWSPRSTVADSLRRIGPTFQNDWFDQNWLAGRPIDERLDDTMPMLPDRCLSSLALAAIETQQNASPIVLPITMRQWIEDGLGKVIKSDLLRGRVFADTFVDSIEWVPVEGDQPEADASDETDSIVHEESIPPDFLLHFSGEPIGDRTDLQSECVIVADLPETPWKLSFKLPAEYYFELKTTPTTDAEEHLRSGWRTIAAVYATLAGRQNLDLYRPLRV